MQKRPPTIPWWPNSTCITNLWQVALIFSYTNNFVDPVTYISIVQLGHGLLRLWLPSRVRQFICNASRCRNGHGIHVVIAGAVLIPAINLPHSRRYGAIYQFYVADGYKNVGTWYHTYCNYQQILYWLIDIIYACCTTLMLRNDQMLSNINEF